MIFFMVGDLRSDYSFSAWWLLSLRLDGVFKGGS